MNNMRKLTEEHLELLASASGVPLVYVKKLTSMGLIRKPRAIDIIVAYYWGLIAQTPSLTEAEFIDYFTNQLGVPRQTIRVAIRKSMNTPLYCSSCGKYIPAEAREAGDGKCFDCIVTEKYRAIAK